ncbi:MAG: hypothetical protein IKG58_01470 [Bacilli bacterium]|nr:hypothetical protein [Bacilli bacterium]
MTLTKNHSIINKQSTKINKAFGGSSSPNVNTKNNVTFNSSGSMIPVMNQAVEPETLELDLDNPIFNGPVGDGHIIPNAVDNNEPALDQAAEMREKEKVELREKVAELEKAEQVYDSLKNLSEVERGKILFEEVHGSSPSSTIDMTDLPH